MLHWTRRLLVVAAAFSLTGCLWGPGKFASDLTVRKNGTFVLDYRGEIVLQLPPDAAAGEPWTPAKAKCESNGKTRPCTATEIASQKATYEQEAATKRKQAED